MNPRSLGGPLLAFASAAVMLGVIAGLVAILVSGDTLSGDDDFIIGEYGFGEKGRNQPLQTKPLESSYPFSPYFRLPPGTRELDIEQHGPDNAWIRQFVLQQAPEVAIADIRSQAEAGGLATETTPPPSSGFAFFGSNIRGTVGLIELDPGVHTLWVFLFQDSSR